MKERINILKIKLSGSGTLFLLSVFLVFSFPASSQPGNPATDKLAGRLHSLAKNSPPELVYLQTSKGIYETGEDLWFKAYLLDAQYLIPSMLSRTLYLQLLNEKNGQAVWQEKYGIDNGFTDGHVYINDTLSEGSYLFAAYTPHSFFADSTEFKAARKITVKKRHGTARVGNGEIQQAIVWERGQHRH